MNYDSIRCYNQDEIPAILERLSNDKQFINVLSTIYPLLPKDVLKNKLLGFRNVEELQTKMIYPFIQNIIDTVTDGVDLYGADLLEDGRSYLYISNHRDIILDSAFLCMKMLTVDRETVEIAIGDNLLIFPWIEDLVRINKSFIVRRNLGAKQILESSKLLSSYIAHTINEKGQSVWIAQREGRAKDSDDKTQESLLKMFNMGGSGTFAENLAELHICPLSISYEYDPCDYLKAKEFQMKRDNPDYVKSSDDDLLNMQTGLFGYKGKVVYKIAGEISKEILELGEKYSNRNELVSSIASLIDSKIYSNYNIFKVNMIAYDILNSSTSFESEYSLMDRLNFEKYIIKQINKIDIEDRDDDFLKLKILEMYANPLRNAMLHRESFEEVSQS
ncbi:MAG: acyltransferase [Bacteroidales bacterium 36-12]|nr:MAG: acyltransferase [Bacteroidales bacterium 36-12]